MIKLKTVFVLGAGASAPYDFPSGIQLTKRIIDLLQYPNNQDAQRISAHERTGNPTATLKGFRDALFYSAKNSVDAFLEHRPNLIELGKRAIAATLIPFERQDSLFQADTTEDWYRHLYHNMNTSFEDFGNNQVVFITYNYDRSLEHFLFTALRNSYGRSEDQVARQLRKIPFIHLHGQLGRLPWEEVPNEESQYRRGYDSEINDIGLDIAAKEIKIIHEDAHNDFAFETALEHLSDATKIIFLGFGYDWTNLTRLRFGKMPQSVVYGSCYKFTQTECDVLTQKFMNKFGKSLVLGRPHEDALSYLREHVVLE